MDETSAPFRRAAACDSAASSGDGNDWQPLDTDIPAILIQSRKCRSLLRFDRSEITLLFDEDGGYRIPSFQLPGFVLLAR